MGLTKEQRIEKAQVEEQHKQIRKRYREVILKLSGYQKAKEERLKKIDTLEWDFLPNPFIPKAADEEIRAKNPQKVANTLSSDEIIRNISHLDIEKAQIEEEAQFFGVKLEEKTA